MDLFEEYQKQQTWRNWARYLQHVPFKSSDVVVDLGCSVGGMSSLLASEVKQVVGIDLNLSFIDFCQRHQSTKQTFIYCDFDNIDYQSLAEINGVWASFSLSYLPNPLDYLTKLYSIIQPGGWIALLDVACFISANLSIDSAYYDKVRQFELQSAQSGIYDFNFGDKMQLMLQQAGFEISYVDNDATDFELNFSGAARADVVQGWSARLERMQKLRQLLGDDYSGFCTELLENLQSPQHQQRGCVKYVVAQKHHATG
ncbi:class I SAM-dependent methyltransferase [Shewanella kaireitica]|uniref:class I SAM-dependent methyltransferase n=1 Tax=Shewanella kaireitica TaxID=212021 RepID=UPI00200E2800|nr:class I SAM-dependent methyltransferase [Shewanella kaireitica]MCL1092270.1 methyltransferase domain-containing protein [Shewanella kaireitica]